VYLFHERTSSREPIDPMFHAKGAPALAHPDGTTGQGGHGGTGGEQRH
jgi:hypothetical protein